MKKKFLLGVLSVATAICMAFGLSACGEDEKSKNKEETKEIADGFAFTSILDQTQTTIIGYSVTADDLQDNTEIQVPSTFKGKPVIEIGKNAFEDYDKLERVVIPDSITTILYCAFNECTSLSSITLPDSVTEIGDYVFRKCSSLSSITFPDNLASIGYGAFKDCTSLKRIVIPDGITSIKNSAFNQCPIEEATLPISVIDSIPGDSIKKIVITSGEIITKSAFANCMALSELTLPDNVTIIEEMAFKNVGFTNFVLPDNVLEIGASAFYGCSNLKKLSLGNSVTTIGWGAFAGCRNLTNITLPDSITKIDEYAFQSCTSLEKITLPESLTSISERTFFNCTALNDFDFRNITEIGAFAFTNCTSLAKITLPAGVTEIGDNAFSYCENLTEIIFDGTIEQWGNIQKDTTWDGNMGEYTVYCTDGMISKNGVETKYSTGLEFELNEDGESYSVVGIGTCEETEIVIPAIHEGKRVTAIGEYAFANYHTSFSISIPNTVTSIESYAFNFCNLISISIPNSVTSIGDYAFSDCYGLTKITIPDSVTSIGSRAFNACKRMTEIFFQGTIAQWKAIEKGSYWEADTLISHVYCKDGALRYNEY